MNDTLPPHSLSQKKTRNRRSLPTWLNLKNPLIRWGLIVLGVVVVVGGQGWLIYNWGHSNGVTAQKKADDAKLASRFPNNGARPSVSLESQGRWTFAGDVTQISATSISIKTKSGDTQNVSVDSKSLVQKVDGTKVELKDIKKGDTIIASGSVNSDGAQYAQRIRFTK